MGPDPHPAHRRRLARRRWRAGRSSSRASGWPATRLDPRSGAVIVAGRRRRLRRRAASSGCRRCRSSSTSASRSSAACSTRCSSRSAAGVALVAVRIRLGRGGALMAVALLLGGPRRADRSGSSPSSGARSTSRSTSPRRSSWSSWRPGSGATGSSPSARSAGALIGTVGLRLRVGVEPRVDAAAVARPTSSPRPSSLTRRRRHGRRRARRLHRSGRRPGRRRAASPRRGCAGRRGVGRARSACSASCLPITESTALARPTSRLTPAGVDADTGAPTGRPRRRRSTPTPTPPPTARPGSRCSPGRAPATADPAASSRPTSSARPTAPGAPTRPIPVGGDFKTLLRLHAGAGMQAVPIYLPADAALDAAEVGRPATARVAFQREKSILQREAKTDNVALERARLRRAGGAGRASGWSPSAGASAGSTRPPRPVDPERAAARSPPRGRCRADEAQPRRPSRRALCIPDRTAEL